MIWQHKKKKRIGLFALSFLVAACSTSYQKGSFSVIQSTENTFSISVDIDLHANFETIKNYTLLKAAEICIANDFTDFVPITAPVAFTTPIGFGREGLIHVKMFKANEAKPLSVVNCDSAYTNYAAKYIR